MDKKLYFCVSEYKKNHHNFYSDDEMMGAREKRFIFLDEKGERQYINKYCKTRVSLIETTDYGRTVISKFDDLSPFLIKITDDKKKPGEFFVMVYSNSVSNAVAFVANEYHCSKIEYVPITNNWVNSYKQTVETEYLPLDNENEEEYDDSDAEEG